MGAERLAWWSRREALGLGLIATTGLLGFGSALHGPGGDLPGSAAYSLGSLSRARRRLADTDVIPFPEIGSYLVGYDATPESRVAYADSPPGLLLLIGKCTHLGCGAPWCSSSEWFECPCHGSRFNRVGEYKFGPAVRGLDRYRLRIVDGRELVADTSEPVQGPPRGTDTIRQPPAGPHCVG